MIELDSEFERYLREDYTMAEQIFEGFKVMRKAVMKEANVKYVKDDEMLNSKEYKLGFLAGVKCMSAMFMDL